MPKLTAADARFETFMEGWLIAPDAGCSTHGFAYLEILEVTGGDSLTVKGDLTTMLEGDERFWIFAPPHVSAQTGAIRGTFTGSTFEPAKCDSRYLWAQYRYMPPMAGYEVNPGTPGIYGKQPGTNAAGTYHTWNRQYDPGTGRWTTPDPAESPWSNLWRYCGCAPMSVTDTTGLDPNHRMIPKSDATGDSVDPYVPPDSVAGQELKRLQDEVRERQEQEAADAKIRADSAKAQSARVAALREEERRRRKANGTDTVELCERTIDGEGAAGDCANATGFRHRWLKACGKEAGLGRQGGGQPEDGGCPLGTPTEIVSHEGQSKWKISNCKPVSGVDVDCVCAHMNIGKVMGPWIPMANDCNSWAASVIEKCTPKRRVTKWVMRTIIHGGGYGGLGNWSRTHDHPAGQGPCGAER